MEAYLSTRYTVRHTSCVCSPTAPQSPESPRGPKAEPHAGASLIRANHRRNTGVPRAGSSAAGAVAWRASRGTVSRGIVRLLESLRTLGREKNLRPDAPSTDASAKAEGAVAAGGTSSPLLHSARQTGQMGESFSQLVRV